MFLKTPTTVSTEATHLTLTISLPGYGYQFLDSSFLSLLKLKQNHRRPCPRTDITLSSRWGGGGVAVCVINVPFSFLLGPAQLLCFGLSFEEVISQLPSGSGHHAYCLRLCFSAMLNSYLFGTISTNKLPSLATFSHGV